MTSRMVQEQNLERQIEKQMGCMAGFLQLFDRNQLLTGKRLYTTKRLSVPPPAAIGALPVGSPAISTEVDMQTRPPEIVPKSPLPLSLPLPLPIFELKQGSGSSWKLCKESPRLSLDSRAIVDAKGSLCPRDIRTNASANQCDEESDDKHRRSPSVIARLMGLEPLPHSTSHPNNNKAELRRSASESRVSRELFSDNNSIQSTKSNHSVVNITSNVTRDNVATKNNECENPKPWRSPHHRRSFFDSADVFPEPKQTMSIYGEIERRLKMRGIEEPSKDLETLKQILEALQLKGLLHSNNTCSHKNFVMDPTNSLDQSPIVVIKPFRSTTPPPSTFKYKSGVHPSQNFVRPSVNPRPEIYGVRSPIRTRNSTSPSRNDTCVRSCNSNSIVKKKPLNIDTHRRVNEPIRLSPINSPKTTIGSDQTSTTTNGILRNKKSTAEIYVKEKVTMTEDESSSNSQSSASTSSQTDTERSKMEEYKEGRSLLERCDKLLHSIAEMTATELQPSPVSVFDYKDESLPPSPVLKRSIHFQGEAEEEIPSPLVSPIETKCKEKSNDTDFVYISEIVRASNYLPEESDVFLLLEKQQYLKGKDTSKCSTLQRKLIFETIIEIIKRNKQLPPWTNWDVQKSSLEQIWLEFQRIREPDTADDLFEIICSVLKKDLAGDAISGWGDCHVEMSEAILYIERLIFKDLVAEMIRDLTNFIRKSTVVAPRRKLVF